MYCFILYSNTPSFQSLTVIGGLLLLEKIYTFFKRERRRSLEGAESVEEKNEKQKKVGRPEKVEARKPSTVVGATEKVSIDTIRAEFHLSRATLRAVKEWMNEDMEKGLEGGIARSTVPMLPSFVPELPTGEEEGTFLAMDLGGTNLRVMIMKISPEQEMKSEQFNTRIPDFAMHGTAEQLFDFIAKCLIDFLVEHGLENKGLPLGFTFSYPCKQTSLRSARLLRWTKGFETRGVVNEDVVQLLEEAIKRDGRAKVEVVALINDTVGTMVAAAYENKTSKMCHIGVIIATGTNASYMERSSKVKFGLAQATEPYPFDGMVVDTEWGGFGDRDEALALKIMTPYDIHVDNSSEHPGVNTFDKLVAGKCMGEVCRLVLERLVSQNLLFNGILDDGIPIEERQEPFFQPGSFPTKYISEILGDESWSSDETKFVLDELDIDRKYMGTTDILLVQEVCRIVSSRSAKLAAAAIACLSERINEKTIYVGIDGSTYKLLPFFEHHVVENIKKLVDPSVKVIAIQTKDGSGKGAALIAAIVSRLKNNALSLEREKVLKRTKSKEDSGKEIGNAVNGKAGISTQKSAISDTVRDSLPYIVVPNAIGLAGRGNGTSETLKKEEDVAERKDNASYTLVEPLEELEESVLAQLVDDGASTELVNEKQLEENKSNSTESQATSGSS